MQVESSCCWFPRKLVTFDPRRMIRFSPNHKTYLSWDACTRTVLAQALNVLHMGHMLQSYGCLCLAINLASSASNILVG